MEEHNNFWFVIIYLTGLCFLGALVYMGALIVFGAHDPDTIENYRECIGANISAVICDLMYPSIPILGVNWTEGVPFP